MVYVDVRKFSVDGLFTYVLTSITAISTSVRFEVMDAVWEQVRATVASIRFEHWGTHLFHFSFAFLAIRTLNDSFMSANSYFMCKLMISML